jgi:hypothetical protein
MGTSVSPWMQGGDFAMQNGAGGESIWVGPHIPFFL